MSKKSRRDRANDRAWVPDDVRIQSPGVQKAFIHAAEKARRDAIKLDKSDAEVDERGRVAGWSNVRKNYYRDSQGIWKPKKSRDPLKERYEKFDELPHDVKQLPTFAVKLWANTYNAATDKVLTKRCDRAWKAVKAMYWFNASTSLWLYKKRVHGRSRTMAKKLREALQSHRHKKSMTFGREESRQMPEKTKKKGFFKLWVPFDSDDNQRVFKVETDESTGRKFLTGVASGPKTDRDHERMSPKFVKKMAKQLPSLNVFTEHEHHLSKTIGHVESAHMVGDEVVARTALEPEWDPNTQLGNRLVSDILMKLESGTKLGYSIAGFVTEFKDEYDEELGKNVPTAIDGELDELTVTARPAYYSELSIAKAIKDLRGEDGAARAEKFRHSSNTDPDEPSWGSVEKSSLPRIAYADMGEPNKKATWKYPHHHIKSGGGKSENGTFTTGEMYLNKGGVNAAWAALHGARSGERGPADVMAHVNSHRKALGLDKTLAADGIEKMIACSSEFVIGHWDVRGDLEKSLAELAPAIRLLQSGRLSAKHRKVLARTIAKATRQVKAGLAVKVISDLYGMEEYQQEK